MSRPLRAHIVSNCSITVRMTRPERDAIQEWADGQDLCMSDAIRLLLLAVVADDTEALEDCGLARLDASECEHSGS